MADESVTEIQADDPVLLIAVHKRSLDEASTRRLVDDVLTAAGRTPRVPVVLDLSRVRFAPSVAVGSLVQLAKSFRLDRRRIALIGVDRRIVETIRVTQLHEVLEIRDNVEAVIATPRDS